MNETGQWQDQLTALGLTGYEARVYLALIGRDRYTAAQLARESGVPRQRIYDVLASLTQRSLVRPLNGRVVAYTAIEPAIAVERLMTAQRAAFTRLEQTTGALVEALVPLWSRGRQETDPLDYVEIIRDQEVLRERFGELHRGAEREILSIAKAPFVITENPAGLETARRVRRAGGRFRAIYEIPAMDDPVLVASIARFEEAGEEARIIAEVPMRMLIADGTQVLMSLRDPVAGGASTTNLLIEHPALAECLTYAFDAIWSAATPVEQMASAGLTR